jgi:biopolymer transport protein ExbD
MKHLSPLLDVILGMLLAFVAIAAVSGAADSEETSETASAEGAPPTVTLRVTREAAEIEVAVDRGEETGLVAVDDFGELALDPGQTVEVTVTDPPLYTLLRELEGRGAAPTILFDTK